MVLYQGTKRQKIADDLVKNKSGIIITTYRTAEIDAEYFNRVFANAQRQIYQRAKESE